MSGYFQRLLVRSAGGGSKIRPLSGQQQGVPLETFSGNAEFLADAQEHFLSPQHDKKSPRSVVGQSIPSRGDMPVLADTLTQFAVLGATTSVDMPSTDTLKPHIAAAHQTIESDRQANHSDANLQRIASASFDSEREFNLEASVSSDEFRLMPSPSRGAATPYPSTAVPQAMDIPRDAQAQTVNLSLPGRQNLQSAEPTEVHVSIGRIEVTAVQAPAPTRRVPAPERKAMSLDEYLAKRGRA